MSNSSLMRNRFRGFLPVVVDIETAGVNPECDAVLEVAVVLLDMDEEGLLQKGESYFEHILPFKGANLSPESLKFNKIEPYHPFRFALEEKKALTQLFSPIKEALQKYRCSRAVLVGHNAWFDLLFLKQAIKRSKITSPFHAFTSFDTATLAATFYGQTVLAKAMEKAGIAFDAELAHSALYDAEKTAELYCTMLNNSSLL